MRSRLLHRPAVRSAGVLLLAATLLASGGGCGDDGTARVTAAPTVIGEPKGTVLVVVAPSDFQDEEFAVARDAVAAAGYEPVVANPDGGTSTSMDGATIDADVSLADAAGTDYDGVVLVGGPGAETYWDDATVHGIVRGTIERGRPLGAICLAPVTLARAGVLQGGRATVWPDNRDDLAGEGCDVQDDAVVVDGLIVTGDGPDASEEFAQAFVGLLRTTGRGRVLIATSDENLAQPDVVRLHDALATAGYTPVVATPSGDGTAESGDAGFAADLRIGDARSQDYVALAIANGAKEPGEAWSGAAEAPEKALVVDAALLDLVAAMVADDKVVGAHSMRRSALRSLVGSNAVGVRQGGVVIIVDGRALGEDAPAVGLTFVDSFVTLLSASRYGVVTVPPDTTPSPTSP